MGLVTEVETKEKPKIFITMNEEHEKDVKEKLKSNNNHCPCSLEYNDDTICMCKEFREQESGWCHCRLYFKGVLNEFLREF